MAQRANRDETRDAPAPGTVLAGRFRVERVAGQGSMGIVLEATDLSRRDRVAVKVMAPDRAHVPDARTRFLREAHAARRLSSKHVTRIYDVGELDDGTPYIVMEYLDGGTLEQVLRSDGLPSLDVAIDWMLQALDGVAEAHRIGLVHRDLKPENIFLSHPRHGAPIVKVLDFGTVKDLTSNMTKLTRSGSSMGSPAYMSPEQVRAEDFDQRTDVWSMGATLYELATGWLPFGGKTIGQTFEAILNEEHIPLRERRPDAPEELEAILSCALSKDPAGRYPSAVELHGALSLVRARMPRTTEVTKTVLIGTPRRHPPPPPSNPTPSYVPAVNASRASAETVVTRRRRSRTTPILVALGGVVAIGAVVALLLMWTRPPRGATVSPTTSATASASPP